MYDTKVARGRLGQYDKPEWRPLRELLPATLVDGFMWMNDIELEGGSRIQAYKHSDTRRYLLLDDECSAWERLGELGFRRMRRSDALEQVFGPWWVLVHATTEERDLLLAAFKSAHAIQSQEGDILPCSPACAFRALPGDLLFAS